MDKNILSKLTTIALALAFALVALPAHAASAKPAEPGPSVTIPALPPDNPDADELAARPDAEDLISEEFPIWAYARFYPIWLPQTGLVVYHCRLAVWWVKDWDGEAHTVSVVGQWEGLTITGEEVSEPIDVEWDYVDNAPWPLFGWGRGLDKWTPPQFLKRGSVEVCIYFDGQEIPDYCPFERSFNFLNNPKVAPGQPSND